MCCQVSLLCDDKYIRHRDQGRHYTNDKEAQMIEPIEDAAHAQPLNQSVGSTKMLIHPKTQTSPKDIIQISNEAKAVLDEAAETHAEITIKAKCGDLYAQRLIDQKIARNELLGID